MVLGKHLELDTLETLMLLNSDIQWIKINRLGCVYVILVHLTNIFCQYELQNTMLRLLQHLFSTAAESIKDKKENSSSTLL